MLEYEVQPHTARVTSVVFDSAESCIITASADSSVKVSEDARGQTSPKSIPGHRVTNFLHKF